MKVIQVQNLQAQGININDHQLLFHGQLFQLGPKISKKLDKAVLEYCQICCKSGQACLLQDDGSHWVVWKRVKKLKNTSFLPSSNPCKLTAFSPQFIDRCKKELVNCIGPIADLVVEQALAEIDTAILKPRDFVAVLSQKIPSSSLATQFYDHCQPASEAEAMISGVRPLNHATEPRSYVSHSKQVHSPASI